MPKQTAFVDKRDRAAFLDSFRHPNLEQLRIPNGHTSMIARRKEEEILPMNSKSIAGVLIAGTLVLSGGSALAAMLPSRARNTSVDHSTLKAEPVTSTATYTVKSGDTLSTVARWFIRHGDGAVWTAHEAAIGSESHLLFSGERITVVRGVVQIAPPIP